MPLTFIRTHDDRITVTTAKNCHAVPPDHPAYGKIVEALAAGHAAIMAGDAAAEAAAEAKIDELAPVPTALAAVTGGRVTVKDGIVYYAGQPCHHGVAKVILKHLRDGFPAAPFMRFLERLMRNPSKRVVDHLYQFCEKFGLTIDSEGYLLGLKRVTRNWTDCHTGSVDNSVGTTVEMPRNAVSDDPKVPCSEGFHFGSAGYVRGFNAGGRVVQIRVDPADVVLVPYDLSQEKARCCKYVVLREHTGRLDAAGEGFKYPVYAADADAPYDPLSDAAW